jgi:radial spoke head protein 9
MEALNLETSLRNLHDAGMCLNLHERMQLDLAISELTANSGCEEVLFWGKITGEKADYFIAMCVHFTGKYEFPDKQFYWASSKDFKFAVLPDPLEQHNDLADSSNPFTGDHAFIIKNLEAPEGEGEGDAEPAAEEGEGDQEAEDSSEDDQVKIPPKNFTELDRLSFTVRAIENDCQLVPIGSIKLTPKHEVRRNEAFKGLTLEAALNPENYIHFRSAQTEAKKELNEQDDAIFRPDFLESIAEDPIKGSWSLQANTTMSGAVIRSFLWPGYVAFHRLGSKVYGGCYIGDGVKNADLPFML